jgi:small subunit ribosomal protein S1
VKVKDGVEGLIAQGDLVEPKDEAGEAQPFHPGDEVEAEIANIDSQERRITLSMRVGEGAAAGPGPGVATTGGDAKPAQRTTKAPKKSAAAEAAGGTIGELIKQKLGEKLAQMNADKKDDEEKDD